MYHTNTGANKDPNNQGVHHPFVSAWEKNDGTSNFTLKYGDATTGGLSTPYSGPLPNGYSPMKLQAPMLFGTGGDNSHHDAGEFFEGAVTARYHRELGAGEHRGRRLPVIRHQKLLVGRARSVRRRVRNGCRDRGTSRGAHRRGHLRDCRSRTALVPATGARIALS